jgi:hypothetical protein
MASVWEYLCSFIISFQSLNPQLYRSGLKKKEGGIEEQEEEESETEDEEETEKGRKNRTRSGNEKEIKYEVEETNNQRRERMEGGRRDGKGRK